MFNETLQPRRLSEVSIQSTVSGLIDNIPLQAINACKYMCETSMNANIVLPVISTLLRK